MTQSEIAKTLNLNMTSTYRYINTLVEMGYLEKDAKSKEIRPAIHCLLFCANLMRATDHLRMIKSVVDGLHSSHNLSIDVAFAVDDTLVRIYYRGAEETLTYHLPDFSRNSLHNTALGKAWLSSLPDEEIDGKIAQMELTAKTPQTIVEKAVLRADIQKSKRRQYALSKEEFLPGLITISAPLFDPLSGKGVGAVCFDFSVLEHSAEDVEEKYAELIRETGRQLSELLPPEKKRRN